VNILNIIDIPWNSGITSYAIESAKGLSKKGYKIFFAGTKNGEPLKIAKEAGFETVKICSRKNPFIFNSVRRLKCLIESEKIDIVNAHTGKGHFLGYAASLFSSGDSVLVRTRSDTARPKKSFLYKKTKRIISASECIRKKYLDIGIEPKKIITICQGINTGASKPPASQGNGLRIGIVGRLDPVKGHRYFLEAAAIVLKRFPDVKFAVAGKEENIKYPSLKKLISELGIEKSVEFSGFVENVNDFMGNCSAGVIASVGSEAVSRVLLEWMACGKPVIATSVGCIPEILGNEYLVPPGNSQALAEKIIAMLSSSQKMQDAGKTNRNKVEADFNFENFVSKTEKTFYEAIDHTPH